MNKVSKGRPARSRPLMDYTFWRHDTYGSSSTIHVAESL
jgi:hypothetical protein